MTAMTPGPRAVRLLHWAEGCRLRAYRDSGGIWTIACGATHYLDGRAVRNGDIVSQAVADALTSALLISCAKFTAAYLGSAPTTPAQFGALNDACYNAGPGNLRASPMLAAHLGRNYADAAAAFHGWHIRDHAGTVRVGLVNRRAAEAALYAGDFATFDTITGS